MSQLQQAFSSSTGQLQKRFHFTWQEFVQVVLTLTVQAYQKMYEVRIAKQDWEENVFTINLEDYLRPIAFDNDLPIYVHSRVKQHTTEMKTGTKVTLKAKELDLVLYGSWERNYDKIHFIWEAKRIGDKRVNSEYSILNSEYVNQGIYRFIRSEYARGLSSAGVLGYVLAGDITNIVSDINKSMERLRSNPPLPRSNQLQIASPVGQFRDIYKSKHTRTDSSLVELHHLFLTFDFT